MTPADNSELLFNIIRESVSLFVLLVFIFLSYRLVDKFGTDIRELLFRVVAAMEKIADNGSQ